jgi:hypothetical protein
VPALERIEYSDAVGAGDHCLAVQGERLGAQLGAAAAMAGYRSVQTWPSGHSPMVLDCYTDINFNIGGGGEK